ncbi:hypothetical protein [Nonomuraea cavernae]|uniref:hypothetical protein n=1 Tax=Nonomuraea cavernae TaxID=2045107 RepID=UPI0034001894
MTVLTLTLLPARWDCVVTVQFSKEDHEAVGLVLRAELISLHSSQPLSINHCWASAVFWPLKAAIVICRGFSVSGEGGPIFTSCVPLSALRVSEAAGRVVLTGP